MKNIQDTLDARGRAYKNVPTRKRGRMKERMKERKKERKKEKQGDHYSVLFSSGN